MKKHRSPFGQTVLSHKNSDYRHVRVYLKNYNY